MHTLRNSLIPVVTYLGVDVGGCMAGAVVTEGIFNVPGVGRLVFARIRRSERRVVIGITTMLVLVYPGRQPAGRPALRRARPEDPL